MKPTPRRRRRRRKKRRRKEEREDILEALKRQRERHEREKEGGDGGEGGNVPKKIAGFIFDVETQRYFPESEMIRRRKKKKKKEEDNNVVVNLMSTMNLRSRSITRSIMSRTSCKRELRTIATIRALRDNKRSFQNCANMDVVCCNQTGEKFSAIAGLNYSTRIMLSQFKEEKCIGAIETIRNASLPFLRFAGATRAFKLLAQCTDAHLGRPGRISIHRISSNKVTQNVFDWNLHEIDGTFRAASWCSQPDRAFRISLGASSTFHQCVHSLLDVRNVKSKDFNCMKSDTMCQAFTNDDSLLLTGCRNGSVLTWDHRREKGSTELFHITSNNGSATSILTLDRNNHRVFVANSRWQLELWDLRFPKKRILEVFSSRSQRASVKLSQFPWTRRYQVFNDNVYGIMNRKSLGCWNTRGEYVGPIEDVDVRNMSAFCVGTDWICVGYHNKN